MSARFIAFYLLVVGAGVGLLIGALPEVAATPLGPLLLWLLLLLAVDAAPVKLPGGGFITVSSTVDYAGILILGPAPVAAAEFVATLLLETSVQRRPLHKVLFNAATFAGTVLVSGWVYLALGGTVGTLPQFPGALLPLVGMGVTYYALNTVVVSTVIALSEHRNMWHVWQTNYLWTVLHMVISLPFALAITVGHHLLGLWGVAVFVLPMLLARYAFKATMDAKRDLIDFAAVLAGVIDEFDPYTRKHSQRVSRYAAQIAREMGLPEREVERVEYGGLLHDIGKISTEHRDLVTKAARLSPEERLRMNQHAAMGADILDKVRAFRHVAPIVRHHHERPDGKGYPAGLSGTNIPMGSRIVLVADAFDAMTTDRVYRPALSLDRALLEFQKWEGRQFDPRVVAALGRLIDKGEIRPASDPSPVDSDDVHARPSVVNTGLAESGS